MAFTAAVTLLAAGAQTISGVGSNVDLGSKTALELVVDVTAVTGTAPTLDLVVETSKNGSTGWRQARAESFDRIDAVGNAEVIVVDCERFVRLRWTVGGTTPSFTFSVAGLAIVVYAGPSHLDVFGLPESALSSLSLKKLHTSLKASTGRIDRALIPAGFVLPLISWDDDLRRDCCVISAYELLVTRGVDPETIDTWVRDRYIELVGQPGQLGDLDKIARRQLVPPNLVDSTPTTEEGGAYVVTDAQRGW